ncbi:MAG: polysaccharide deacetylase family protein [Clostridia bacterium]|nr:polysaccharide deacetylase family protein [Clostridia bacterium]
MAMKHLNRIFGILLILLSVLLFLCGCSAAEQTSADASAELPETEVVTSPMTEPPETVPVEESAIVESETEAETEAPKSARIAVPRLSGKTQEEAEAILQEAGIPYTVVEVDTAQYDRGTVTKLQFYGALDEEYCYINPNYPTELLVSIGRRWKTNVSAVDPKRVYLTFDDGPHHNTDTVLEILDTYGIKATFFTLGMYVAVYPERIQKMVDSGHLLACHSYTHDYNKLYASADEVLSEIAAWEAAVEHAGIALPEQIYFRFPGGSTTTYMSRDRYEEIFWAVTDAGYYAMDWTCANNDRYLNGKREEQSLEDFLVESALTTTKNLAYSPSLPKIMLLHDVADETAATLAQVIEGLLAEGYTFGTLDELDGYWVFE